MLYLRAGAFYTVFYLSTMLFALLSLALYLLPFRYRYAVLTSWADLNLWSLQRLCKLDYRVEGLENIPDQPSIIMSNHQSSWETLALKKFFPPLCWVVKRELLWIPFFGWGLAISEPIALDRSSGEKAVEQLVSQARRRLRKGRWVVIFPEGTRVEPGQKKHYKLGGAIVASKTQVPVVPVAHNAGQFWRRRQFVKYPGTIVVSIGPPIDPHGKSPLQINTAIKTWIEAKLEEIYVTRPS